MAPMGAGDSGLSDGDRTDTIAAYTSACAFFGERLAAVTELDWERPTPCGDWDVGTVVAHVVTGESLVTRVLRDSGAWEGTVDRSVLGANPMAAWRGTALAALESAAAAGVLDAMHPHAVGDVPGAVIVGFRVTENLVHGWDLASACDQAVELPEALAARCLDFWLPLVDADGTIGGSGAAFGPPVLPPGGASSGVRLLALLGRAA